MKKATRILLATRPNSQLVATRSIAFEKAIANECYDNTMRFLAESGEQFVMASGWLVGDYVSEVGTAVIPHYWVVNATTKEHFDPTPIAANDTFEYVWDLDIAELGANFKCALPLALMLRKEGNFEIRIKPNEYVNFDVFNLNYLFQLTKDN